MGVSSAPAPSEESSTPAAPGRHVPPTGSIPRSVRQNWEDLYVKNHRVIWRTLRRIGFSPDAAAEATQQAFLISIERWKDVRSGAERAFLFSTAIRQAKTSARKQRRMDLSDELDPADLGRMAERLDQRQMALSLLEQVLSKMDPDLVTVFCLYELEELRSPEIAELLGIPVGTVASRLRRGREAFRKFTARLDSPLRRLSKPQETASGGSTPGERK